MFGLSEEDLKLREVIKVDIAEEMFPEDENLDDPCTFQSKVHSAVCTVAKWPYLGQSNQSQL